MYNIVNIQNVNGFINAFNNAKSQNQDLFFAYSISKAVEVNYVVNVQGTTASYVYIGLNPISQSKTANIDAIIKTVNNNNGIFWF